MRKLLAFVFVLVGVYSYSQSFCGGSSATLQALNPQNLSNPGYSLNPGGFQNSSGVFVVSPPATTTYTLYTTGQNTSNVIVTTSAVTIVTVNAQPNSVPTLTQSTCTSSNNAFNLNLTFNPATPAPGYTIAWSSIPSGILSPTQYSVTGGAVTAGPYTATITAAGGCSLIVNFTMNPQPAPAIFSVTPFGATHSITCITPTVVLSTTDPNLTYTWSSTSFTPVTGPSVSLDATSLGTINCTGQNTVSGCTTSYTFLIVQNVSVPSSTLSNTLFNITCTQTVVPTLTIVASPSVNVNNCIISPGATGTFCASSYSTIYTPGIPGAYTVCSLNTENGCSTCKSFTVTSSDSYPTFTVTSPQNFTLGCTTKSVATINIVNAQTIPFGGAVTYSLYPPNYTLGIPSGTSPLSPLSNYTVNTPGSWTVVVMDNANYCKSANVISVLQNTFTPNISANVPRQILDCGYTVTILEGLSETTNVSYNWAFVGTPGNINGNTVTVTIKPANNTQTLINTYTLSVTDNNNTCKSFSIIPMAQNIFPPNTNISNGGINALTCKTQSIVLTNQSSTGIPSSTGYPTNQPVISSIWYGPPPQESLQLSTTYIAQVVGTYTLVGLDLNNSCTSTGTIEIFDNLKYPVINQPTLTPIVLDCGATSVLIRPVYSPSTGLTYTWTGAPGSGTVGLKNNASYPVTKPGTYSVVAQNSVNGCAENATFTVYNGSLTANFVPNVVSGFAPLSVSFTNNSSSSDTLTGKSGIVSYWNYSNGDSSITKSTSISPQTVYSAPGSYVITMYSIKGECLDTAFATIKVLSASSLTVPNVFTPNGDGVNDLFFLKADNLTEVTIVIYDRWGHLTYEITSNSGNVEWNGKNQFDKECAEGVYFYYLKAKGLDGETYDQNGSINLLR